MMLELPNIMAVTPTSITIETRASAFMLVM